MLLGFDRDFAPFTFVEDGRPAGVVVEIIHVVAEETGLELELLAAYLAKREALLSRGEIQGWACMAIVAKRTSRFVFSLPFLETGGALFRLRGDEHPLRRVATPVAGPLFQALPAVFPGIDTVAVNGGYRETLEVVRAGDADAAALNIHAGMHLAEAWYPGAFTREGELFAPVGLAMAVLADRAGAVPGLFDTGLERVASRGELRRMVMRGGLGEEAIPAWARPGEAGPGARRTSAVDQLEDDPPSIG